MFRRLLLLTLLLTLTGCAYLQRMRQEAIATKETSQTAGAKLLRAPADWGDLARDVAYRLSQRASQLSLGDRLVYVAEPAQPTPFALALRQYLQSNLSEQGVAVAQRRSETSLVLEADVQSVKLASGLQIVVTTALGNGARYLFRGTEAYAVNQADVKLYDASLLPPPPPPPAPPSVTKQMTVTGSL
ncbi:hypothetical protein [Chitinimonas sp.]|uniref:hypothetical protein n=1 Tax=Chitinimonas sp. TaxID=1934313 RepID=UPI002F951D5B